MRNKKTDHYIRTIARTRNISAAAEELGISQPALSASLKKAEKEIGAPIFDRSTTPLTLTEAGSLYLEFEDSMQALERELSQKLSDINQLLSGELVVGGATSFNMSYLPKALAKFSASFPDVHVSIVDGTSADIAQAAANGQVDVFLSPLQHESSMFDSELLTNEKILLCVPSSWPEVKQLPSTDGKPYAAMGPAEFKRLQNKIFIVLDEGLQIGDMMHDIFDLFDMHPKHVIHAEQTLTSLAMTLQGIGVSLISEGSLEISDFENRLALFLPDERICTRSLYIVTPKNRYVSRAAREFINIMRSTVHPRG